MYFKLCEINSAVVIIFFYRAFVQSFICCSRIGKNFYVLCKVHVLTDKIFAASQNLFRLSFIRIPDNRLEQQSTAHSWKHTFYSFTWRGSSDKTVLYFTFCSARVDGLSRREESSKELTEVYTGREDFLCYRHAAFQDRVKKFGPQGSNARPVAVSDLWEYLWLVHSCYTLYIFYLCISVSSSN